MQTVSIKTTMLNAFQVVKGTVDLVIQRYYKPIITNAPQ
jgi:hypothetical protein